MSESLDIHPASPEERLQAYRNVHDVWGRGLDLESHVEQRLASVQHNRADWFVGTLNGKVATSLAAYPLPFRLSGEVVPGFAIGSVHTAAPFRRRGFAARLIRWVESFYHSSGARLSLLYSDIDPAYYARLGYERCPAWEGWASPFEAGRSAGGATLEPFEPTKQLDQLAQHYRRCCACRAVSIERDKAYWNYLLRKSPHDQFYWIRADSEGCLGYVRLENDGHGTAKIHDWAIADDGTGRFERALSALVNFCQDQKFSRVGGWMPDVPAARSVFSLVSRRQEITMLKDLAGPRVGEPVLQDAAHFCEIDHV